MIQNDKEEREINGVYQLTDGKDFYIHDFDISNEGKSCMYGYTKPKRLYEW